MTRNLKLLINFVEKFLGTVKFGNDQIAPILGYGDLVQGAVTIKRVYYVEGLNHNLFSVGQFCDVDLEVAFRKSTCFIRDLKGNDLLTGSRGTDLKSTCFIRDLKGNDLLTSSRGTDLYSISLQSTGSPNPLCLMAKATLSQAWLWHRRLSYLNFDTINLLSKNDIVVGLPKLKFVKDHLCSSCELGKAKRKSFHTKLTPSLKRRLHLLHMDLCGPIHVASINRKRYVLVIVDDYSRYTWTQFLRSKDETPEVLIDFLMVVQRGLQAQVRVNGVVERRNRTLVEAARTMLSAAKVPLFFWAKAIATSCFTQNCSLVIPRHEKTPYHIINERKPSVKFFYIFGSVCYIVRDGENLDKMKEKVIVDDYSRYTWTHFLRSKDETPEVLIDFLRLVQRGLQAQVRVNGIVERQNRTLVEAARTMLSAAKVPLFFWAEAIATACFTQNRSLVIPRHEKTPYHIINERKPSVKFFHIFGSVCYIVRDGENLDKMKEKGDECIFMGLSPGRKCQENVSHEDKTCTTSNELDLLFSPMFDELLNGFSKVVSKSSAVSAADAPNQRQQPSTPLNNHRSLAPT
nr:putative ribonuclease H-like domain-containing protein [Tanacetum cinerariifolium]